MYYVLITLDIKTTGAEYASSCGLLENEHSARNGSEQDHGTSNNRREGCLERWWRRSCCRSCCDSSGLGGSGSSSNATETGSRCGFSGGSGRAAAINALAMHIQIGLDLSYLAVAKTLVFVLKPPEPPPVTELLAVREEEGREPPRPAELDKLPALPGVQEPTPQVLPGPQLYESLQHT
jgi:hypothetical protein